MEYTLRAPAGCERASVAPSAARALAACSRTWPGVLQCVRVSPPSRCRQGLVLCQELVEKRAPMAVREPDRMLGFQALLFGSFLLSPSVSG